MSGTFIFNTAEELFDTVFGSKYDSHVHKFRCQEWMHSKNLEYAIRYENMMAEAELMMNKELH